MTALDIKPGALYSAKNQVVAEDGHLNDRRVLELKTTVRGVIVSYRSPAVLVGEGELVDTTTTYEDGSEKEFKVLKLKTKPSTDPNTLPARCKLEDFIRWAKEDVTNEATEDGWRKL